MSLKESMGTAVSRCLLQQIEAPHKDCPGQPSVSGEASIGSVALNEVLPASRCCIGFLRTALFYPLARCVDLFLFGNPGGGGQCGESSCERSADENDPRPCGALRLGCDDVLVENRSGPNEQQSGEPPGDRKERVRPQWANASARILEVSSKSPQRNRKNCSLSEVEGVFLHLEGASTPVCWGVR